MKPRGFFIFALTGLCLSARIKAADLPSFTVVPGQVYQASVVLDAEGRSDVSLSLVSEKRLELADFTRRYLNQQVQIVVDGKTLTQPIIRSQILSGSISLPCASPEAALELAKTLMAR